MDLIAVLKYLMEHYRKRLNQTICRYSVKGLEGLGTSLSEANCDCVELKEIIARASWTGYWAFVFENNKNSSANSPEEDITLKLAFL